jgi:hypothetical protein
VRPVLFRLDQLPSRWDIAQNIEGSLLAPVLLTLT